MRAVGNSRSPRRGARCSWILSRKSPWEVRELLAPLPAAERGAPARRRARRREPCNGCTTHRCAADPNSASPHRRRDPAIRTPRRALRGGIRMERGVRSAEYSNFVRAVRCGSRCPLRTLLGSRGGWRAGGLRLPGAQRARPRQPRNCAACWSIRRERGLGIGPGVVERCLAFAKSAGYAKMMLWTNDVLAAARRIYVCAGFKLVEEWPFRSRARSGRASWAKDL